MCIVLIFSEMLLSFFFTSFKPSAGVIIGATSFPEVLDKYVLKDCFYKYWYILKCGWALKEKEAHHQTSHMILFMWNVQNKQIGGNRE